MKILDLRGVVKDNIPFAPPHVINKIQNCKNWYLGGENPRAKSQMFDGF